MQGHASGGNRERHTGAKGVLRAFLAVLRVLGYGVVFLLSFILAQFVLLVVGNSLLTVGELPDGARQAFILFKILASLAFAGFITYLLARPRRTPAAVSGPQDSPSGKSVTSADAASGDRRDSEGIAEGLAARVLAAPADVAGPFEEVPQTMSGIDAEVGLAAAHATLEADSGPGTTSRNWWILIAGLVLAVVALAAGAVFVIPTLSDRAADSLLVQASASPSATPTASDDEQREEMRKYLARLDCILLSYLWASSPHVFGEEGSKRYVGWPLGVTHVLELDGGDLVRWWGDPASKASSFRSDAQAIASGLCPREMRSANRKMARVFTIESERWRRFSYFAGLPGEQFWPEYRSWRKWSKDALRTQQRLLDDWYLELQANSRALDLDIPYGTRRFVRVVLATSE